jgi:hypothetical protein
MGPLPNIVLMHGAWAATNHVAMVSHPNDVVHLVRATAPAPDLGGHCGGGGRGDAG